MAPAELTKIRQEIGLTQTEMAEQLGYGSYRNYHRLETGERAINARTATLIKRLRQAKKRLFLP